MKIERPHPLPPLPGPQPTRRPSSPEEAAKQFEEVLVRQFVKTLTDGLFKTGLAGEGGPGWMSSYQQTQRDVLTDVLTKHLVDQGTLRLSDLLTRQWSRTGATPPTEPSDTPKP
ncbi:MAG: hypothetical protein KatS3mg044_0618 [Rhodothermaceae bacterium]|nr:MAG: hypothetical protein KatS3mg044_0618 [Rhodothermaceae bacterium]